jgi:hypothetical protein
MKRTRTETMSRRSFANQMITSDDAANRGGLIMGL